MRIWIIMYLNTYISINLMYAIHQNTEIKKSPSCDGLRIEKSHK
jgi:hypothetical protein